VDMAPFRIAAALALVAPVAFGATAAELPEAIDAKGETVVLQVHAEGAQIYECKSDASGRATWQFREPIASLFRDGKPCNYGAASGFWKETEGTTQLDVAALALLFRIVPHCVQLHRSNIAFGRRPAQSTYQRPLGKSYSRSPRRWKPISFSR
jgi:hypothetical protein